MARKKKVEVEQNEDKRTIKSTDLSGATIESIVFTSYGSTVTGMRLTTNDGRQLIISPSSVNYDQYSSSPCLSVEVKNLNEI